MREAVVFLPSFPLKIRAVQVVEGREDSTQASHNFICKKYIKKQREEQQEQNPLTYCILSESFV
jgi:hypothetical protein